MSQSLLKEITERGVLWLADYIMQDHRGMLFTLFERRFIKMKINFKKIVSVLATTVMLGSTVAFAAAAYPEPFVKNGAADAALVVGANAAATDMAAATDLGASLDAKVTVTGATTVVVVKKLQLMALQSFKLDKNSQLLKQHL